MAPLDLRRVLLDAPGDALQPHLGLILQSLALMERKVDDTTYPTYELRAERLAELDAAIAAVRSIRKATA
jgi:hypothetical protein